MEIVVRAAIVFALMWVVTRGLGKRQLAEMTPFEMILLVTVGDLVQQGITGDDSSIIGAFLAVGTFALLVLATSYISYRSKAAQRVLDGAPLVLVDNAETYPERMHWERLTGDDLAEAARNHGISSLDEVRMAILEPDGKFSFITYDQEPDSSEGDRGRIE